MKNALLTSAVLALISASANAQAHGNCATEAQAAANAIGKINHFRLASPLRLVGQPNQVETYRDAQGYFEIVTNTEHGEDTCIVEQLQFNPEP